MPQCKITVLKKMIDDDLAEAYCPAGTGVCSAFEVGQAFIAKYPQKEPDGFPCSGAWSSMSDFVFVLLSGGSFGPSGWNWMKKDRMMISCCPDGVRPVIFKLELMEDHS